jgi:tRNA pseudouridine55 synthase
LDGILVVDKPTGPTSFDVVRRLRALGRDRKAGHLGTLDPLASGVLPVCLGEATKIVPFIAEGGKVYEGTVRLGIETDSYDAAGKTVAEADASGLDRERVEAAVRAFAGEYWQTPPMVSAAKVGGKRLYELARRGEEVERRPRKVRIAEIELLAFTPGPVAEATIRLRCSKGTYVRSIAHELGEALGVGGHLSALRRLASEPFRIERAVPLDRLLAWSKEDPAQIEAHLVPMTEALAAYRELRVDDERARKVGHGMALGVRDLVASEAGRIAAGERVRVVDRAGRLLAVGEYRDGAIRYLRVLVTGGGTAERAR